MRLKPFILGCAAYFEEKSREDKMIRLAFLLCALVLTAVSFATSATLALYRNRNTGKVAIDIISGTGEVTTKVAINQPILQDLTSVVVGPTLYPLDYPTARYDVTYNSPSSSLGEKSTEFDANGKWVNYTVSTNRGPLVGIGDFDNNGVPELIFHIVSANRYGGMERGASFSLATSSVTQGTYTDPIGICDADGDGHPDIIFRDPATNFVKAMLFSGRTATAMEATAFDPTPYMPAGWKIVGVSDIDGNGTPDLFVRGPNLLDPIKMIFRLGNTVTQVKKLTGSQTRDILAIGQG
jgi:hypothetical protein